MELQYDLQHIGPIIISKPLNRAAFVDILHFIAHFNAHVEKSFPLAFDAQPKEEAKILIAKSKQLLIRNLNLAEPCAHRYIQNNL